MRPELCNPASWNWQTCTNDAPPQVKRKSRGLADKTNGLR
jgi:hypothetical protein